MAKKDKEGGKKSNKGLIIIVVILLLVVVLAVGVVGFLLISKKDGGEVKVQEEVLMLDEIIVNIDDPSMKKYAKFALAITYDGKDKDILEDLTLNTYKIKDGIISIFKQTTAQQIESTEGMEKLKQDLKAKIDSILEDNTIISVYFTNLLIH